MPKVSVIIPTYNREKFIVNCIESVINQTYKDLEIIIVDDGSTDNTREIVAQFDNKIKYIFQENAGVQTARNKGFYAAQGDYILFLDSDDRLLPHNLETLIKKFQKDSDVDVSYGWYFWEDENHNPVINQFSKIKNLSYPPQDSPWAETIPPADGTLLEGQIFREILKEETILIGSTLIRRECFETIGGFNPTIKYMEHWDFFTRIAKAGFKFACTRRPVSVICLHGDNRGKNIEGMLSSAISLINQHSQESGQNQLSAQDIKEAYFETYYSMAAEYFVKKNIKKGLEILQKAYQYKPAKDLKNNETTKLISEMLVTISYENQPDKPEKYIKELFSQIKNKKQSKVLREITLNTIYQMQFWTHENNNKLVRFYGFKALENNPKLLSNLGFVKTIFKAILPKWVMRLTHALRYPVDHDFIKKASEKTCIFISPHFDDAALSCGGLMSGLAEKETEIIVVTVFTEDMPEEIPLSSLAENYHRVWGVENNPYQIRKDEEKNVLKKLKSQSRWLGYLDVIYRFPDIKLKNESLFTGINPADDPVFSKIKLDIEEILTNHPDCLIFLPLGLGNHPDHVVVHLAVRAVLETNPDLNFYYYEDFPYAISADLNEYMTNHKTKLKSVNIDIRKTLSKRIELIKLYKSQLDLVFENPEEIDKVVKTYTERVGTKGFSQERYWYAK